MDFRSCVTCHDAIESGSYCRSCDPFFSDFKENRFQVCKPNVATTINNMNTCVNVHVNDFKAVEKSSVKSKVNDVKENGIRNGRIFQEEFDFCKELGDACESIIGNSVVTDDDDDELFKPDYNPATDEELESLGDFSPSQVQIPNQSQSQVQHRSQNQGQSQIQNQNQGQSQDQSQGQIQNQNQGQSQDQSQGQIQNQNQGQSQDQTQNQNQNQAQNQGQSQNQNQNDYLNQTLNGSFSSSIASSIRSQSDKFRIRDPSQNKTPTRKPTLDEIQEIIRRLYIYKRKEVKVQDPLPPADIRLLTTMDSEAVKKHLKLSRRCSLCFQLFEMNEPICKLGCFDAFHYNCITLWLELSGNCPKCEMVMSVDSLNASGDIGRMSPEKFNFEVHGVKYTIQRWKNDEEKRTIDVLACLVKDVDECMYDY